MKFLLIAGLAESLLNFRGALIAELQARKIEVHVAAPDLHDGSSLRVRLEGLGIKVHGYCLSRTGTSAWKDLGTITQLLGIVREVQPQVMLAYTVKPVIYGGIAARLAGARNFYALITGLGYTFQAQNGRAGLQLLVRQLYRLGLRWSTKVFFQNPDDEKLFRSAALLRRQTPSVVVNGSGVDLKIFAPSAVPADGPSFLLIARLLGDKGVREYAIAARRIRAAHPHVRFNLAGWIDENPDAIKVEELDRWVEDGTLSYLGRLGDVREAIAACTVYVLPSYREGTPRTVLEAMALGRAVITTDAPGCRETVVHGDNGLLVSVRSIDELEAAMLEFVREPSLAIRMGRRSREIAEHKYDVHSVNAVMIKEMGIVGTR